MGLRVLEKATYFASVGNRTPIRRSVPNEYVRERLELAALNE